MPRKKGFDRTRNMNYDIFLPFLVIETDENIRKYLIPTRRFTFFAKRLLDLDCIIGSSGEPVSKYRVKVLCPGRQEIILFSGAPTCLGHRSLFFLGQF